MPNYIRQHDLTAACCTKASRFAIIVIDGHTAVCIEHRACYAQLGIGVCAWMPSEVLDVVRTDSRQALQLSNGAAYPVGSAFLLYNEKRQSTCCLHTRSVF